MSFAAHLALIVILVLSVVVVSEFTLLAQALVVTGGAMLGVWLACRIAAPSYTAIIVIVALITVVAPVALVLWAASQLPRSTSSVDVTLHVASLLPLLGALLTRWGWSRLTAGT